MDIIDFENTMTGSMGNDIARDHIGSIYSLISSEVPSLARPLCAFHEYLITYYTENRNLLEQGYTPEQMAKSAFSQFLQHLFHYILRSRESNDLYAKGRLLAILQNHPDDFFYHPLIDDKLKVTLWIDPSTGETALTGACRKMDQEIVGLVLERLKIAFNIKSQHREIPTEFENYLFHENNLGHSALTITQLRNKQANEERLLNFAKYIYGNKNTIGFQRFVFQVDSKGHSALMRAVMKGNKKLILLLIENVNRVYQTPDAKEATQHLFMYQDKKGETVLHKTIEKNNFELLELLLHKGISIFGGIKKTGFKQFIVTPNNAGVTPLILASQKSDRNLISRLLEVGFENDPILRGTIQRLIMWQDNEGYSALMRAVEIGSVENVKYLLNSLINMNDAGFRYDVKKIFNYIRLQTIYEESVFQIAVNNRHWKVLEILIEVLSYISPVNTRDLLMAFDVSESNVLTKLYREEQAFRLRLVTEMLVPSFLEKQASQERLNLAKKLASFGLRSSESMTTIESWRFIERTSPPEGIINFFSIFCPTSSLRVKRSDSCTFFAEEDLLQASFPENPDQMRKEALVNMMAIFTRSNLDSLEQVKLIRNGSTMSEREKAQLARFDYEVTEYYTKHGHAILARLKAKVAPNLEAAFESSDPHIFVDYGNNFLLISKEKIFLSLLNSVKLIPLKPELSNTELKHWLDGYLGEHYTLYTFDAELFKFYPKVLVSLVESPILSDAELLNRYYENVQGETLRRLFLLEDKPIEIELDKLTTPNFLDRYGNSLSLRAENFHEIFFSLSLSERYGLKEMLTKYNISPAKYQGLTTKEEEYISVYGKQIINLIKSTSPELITPVAIFEISVNTHEQLLITEGDLSVTTKKQMIDSFRKLKERLTLGEKGIAHGKAALQLIVLLFPSAIRAIVNKNPVAMAIPLGLIATDVVLRELLISLVNHPQVLQIFTGQLTNKVLSIIDETAQRIPIIGSALALYGLIQSGKALITADKQDPNRSYYAHLLINNAITVGVMSAEVAVSLPFWPVLGLFAALTADQVATEGARLHDVVLNIKDDKNHPLLKFYRKLELGLGIVDADIKVVEEQRQLFHNFINYLNTVQAEKGDDAIVAVTLPEVRNIKVHRGPLKYGTRQKAIGCSSSGNSRRTSIYSQSGMCTRTALITDKKENYSFELGKRRTLCEKRDPFYMADITSNFTVLVGTQSFDCSKGREIEIDATAVATGKNAAGLLVNKNLNSTLKPYSLFLPIDPLHVASYSFTLKKNVRDLAVNEGLNQWLPCSEAAVHCINKIRVIVAELFSITPIDQTAQTQVSISDNELRQNISSNNFVQEIEYLIAISRQVIIHPNKIPQQTFAFFKDDYNLQFENNLLKSDNGFQASLAEVKKITLEFNDKANVFGTFVPQREQEIVINHLKGESEEKTVILNTTQCKLFSVGLGRYTRFFDKAVEIAIKGNFQETSLEVYRHAKNNDTFYQLLQPINYLMVNGTEGQTLSLTLQAKSDAALVLNVKPEAANEKVSVVFSGRYEIGDQVYFSQVIMYKSFDMDWKCDLVINANTLNSLQSIDLEAIRSQNFNKVSILTSPLDSFKITHYFFYQSQLFPSITGNFIDYRLATSKDGWLLVLKHEHSNEETKIFLAENASIVSINNIHYAIKPAAAALFAISTENDAAIDSSYLIAPLAVETPFYKTPIFIENKLYKIGNLSLINLLSSGVIYFDGQSVAIADIKYILTTNQTRPIITVNPASILDSQQIAIKKANIFNLVAINSKNWSERIHGLLLTGAAIMTTAISASFFMLVKRFKRPRPQLVNIVPLASTVPLLNPSEAVSVVSDVEELNDLNVCPISNQGSKLNESIKIIAADNRHFSDKSLSSVSHVTGLNPQLTFLNYLLRYYNKTKTKRSDRTNTKIKKSKFTNKSANFLFYTQSVAANTQDQENLNNSSSILKLI